MDEEKVHFTKHFTKEGREMSRYYTLVQGKQTGRTERCKISILFVFFSSARLLKKRPYTIDKMLRNLRVAIPSPPPRQGKTEEKERLRKP